MTYVPKSQFIAMAIVNGMPVTSKLSSCLKKYYRPVSVACSSAGVMITVNHDVVDYKEKRERDIVCKREISHAPLRR